MTPRKVALARTLPILIGTAIFGAIILFLSLRTMQGIEQSQEVAARFESLAGVCITDSGRPTTDGGTGRDGGSGDARSQIRGVAFRLVGGEWVYDATALPAEMRAAGPDEARTVLCLGPSEPLVTTACDVDDSGVAPTRVYGERLTVRLLEAQSGALMAEDVLPSAPEIGCRDEQGAVIRVSQEMLGEWVTGEVEIGEIRDWRLEIGDW